MVNDKFTIEEIDGKKVLTRVSQYATSIIIPDSVKEIGESAFYGCSLLTSIVIPGCWRLKEMHIRVKDPTNIEVTNIFSWFTTSFDGFDVSVCALYVPVSAGYRYRHHDVFGKVKEVVQER